MKLEQCPACGSDLFHPFLAAKDNLVSEQIFNIAECDHCELRFTNPRPNDADLATYYDSTEYISHSNTANSLTDQLYKIARLFTIKSKLKLVNKYRGQGQLLDVGCGTGSFLSACTKDRWLTSGVEPNELARNQALKDSTSSVYKSLDEINGAAFDVISLWHVLEHLPDLPSTLNKLKSLLATNGKLIIAVPNFDAYENKIFDEYWAAYDVPRHLYHFNQNSMRQLLRQHGLNIVKTYPMWLDSFYISLLSNQHKYGRKKYLNSFLTGLLSNIYALKSKNYSSLIYLVAKDEK